MQNYSKWRPPSEQDKIAFYTKQKQLKLFPKKKRSAIIKGQIQFVLNNIQLLSSWERNFVQSLALTSTVLSVKQNAALDKVTEYITQKLIILKKKEQQERRVSGEREVFHPDN